MLIKLSKFGVLLILAGVMSACASSPFYHNNFMQGQVVNVDDQGIVICTGSGGKSIEGQRFSVYRSVYEGGTQEGDDGYRISFVGEMIGSSTINEHFARAERVSGNIRKHDFVEIKQ